MKYMDGRSSPDRDLVRVGGPPEFRGAEGPGDQRYMAGQEWTDYAACRHHDPELFFAFDEATQAIAEAVCKGCPVRVECEGLALRTRERTGVWGGQERSKPGRKKKAVAERYSSTLARITELGSVAVSS